VTGAGRNPKRELLFGEVAEDYRAYAIGNTHRHLAELKQSLAREGGFTGDLVFHAAPAPGEARHSWKRFTCVDARARSSDRRRAVQRDVRRRALHSGDAWALPSLRDVVYRNRVAIGVAEVADVRRPRLTVIAAIDNLVKGAQGGVPASRHVLDSLPCRALHEIVDRGDHGQARPPHVGDFRDADGDAVAIHHVAERRQRPMHHLNAGLVVVRRAVTALRRSLDRARASTARESFPEMPRFTGSRCGVNTRSPGKSALARQRLLQLGEMAVRVLPIA